MKRIPRGRSVGPGNFAFQFERNAGIGKREAKLRWPFLGQLPDDSDGHASLAHVGHRRSQFLNRRKTNP